MKVAPVVQALLSRAIDYAGLFAPASLSMAQAVANYGAYFERSQSWALGRFVLPIGRLEEYLAARGGRKSRRPWPLSLLCTGMDLEEDVSRVRAFNRLHFGQALIESLELRPGTPQRLSPVQSRAGKPLELFYEIPLAGDVQKHLHEVVEAGGRAKIRTGGVTEETVPDSAAVARFLEHCATARVAFKATAGLHHAVRGKHPLTYERASAATITHGFVNLLLAAAYARAGWKADQLIPVLNERSANAFRLQPTAWSWLDHPLRLALIRAMRAEMLLSFGSCSFEEPLAEMETSGWLPA